jgi:hypothetical protein
MFERLRRIFSGWQPDRPAAPDLTPEEEQSVVERDDADELRDTRRPDPGETPPR